MGCVRQRTQAPQKKMSAPRIQGFPCLTLGGIKFAGCVTFECTSFELFSEQGRKDGFPKVAAEAGVESSEVRSPPENLQQNKVCKPQSSPLCSSPLWHTKIYVGHVPKKMEKMDGNFQDFPVPPKPPVCSKNRFLYNRLMTGRYWYGS